MDKLIDSVKFKSWLFDEYDHNGLILSEIQVKSTLFVKSGLLFATFTQLAVERRTGKPVPGFTFLRGGAATFLIVVKDTTFGMKWTIVTWQARAAIGSARFPELPAGMLDNNTIMKALEQEMDQEINLSLKGASIVRLGAGYPSPGATAELIEEYYIEYSMPLATIERMQAKWTEGSDLAMQGRKTGNKEEQEAIVLEFIPLWKLATVCDLDWKTKAVLWDLHKMFPNEKLF